MKKASLTEKNSNFTNSSNLSLVSLVITQNDKQIRVEDLDLNMIIKYQNEWYAVKLRENTMNDYFLIFRDELKTLKEYLENYNSFMELIEQNPNQTIFKPYEIKNAENIHNIIPRAETGIKEEENPVDENLRTNVLSTILNKIEEDKRILYQFANKDEIDYHYDKLKQIIFKLKSENQEKINNYYNMSLAEINNIKINKSPLINRTLTVTNDSIQGENKLSDVKFQIKPDVKVLIEEENHVDNNINIFSYISDDQIISNLNSNNFDSNNYQINSNLDSRNLNSAFDMPYSENININSTERVLSNNSLIGMKRNHRESIVNPFNQNEEMNQTDLIDIKNKKLKEDTISSLFSIRHLHIKLKRFSLNCINCGISIKIIKMEKICCENYICKRCVMKNYTFLSELIENFNVDKFKIERCFSSQYKLFFCNFCYLIDRRENLEECCSALCNNLFHKDCYVMMRIVDRNLLNLDKTEKTRICEEIVSQIIEEEKKKKTRFINEKFKNANVKFLKSCCDSGQLSMVLYKFNKRSFYKFFINYFVRYMIKNKEKFNPNFTNHKDGMVCKNHLCLSCFQPIDELSGEDEGFLKFCCNNIHNDCYHQDNSHIEYIYQKNTSHLSILHLKFIREFYDFVKKISKYNNYHAGDKMAEQKSPIYSNGTILENQAEISIYQDMNSNLVGKSSNELDYSHLTEKEKEDVMKSFIEIFSNKISRKLCNSMEKKNKIERGLSKCECLSEIVKNYRDGLIPAANKRYTNLRSSIASGENINKLIKDQNFIDFVKSQGFCCNDTCTNRILKIECFKKTCDCPADFCLNRYDNPKYYEDFEIIRTSNRGYGLICNKDIKKGEFIIQYVGEVIDYSTLIEKSSNLNPGNYTQWYVMSLEKNLYIDASKYGNKARFINHSCNPNAVLEKWFGQRFFNKIFLFATRDIPAGTEINYNYNFNYFRGDFKQDCKCGEKSCCLIMGGTRNHGRNKEFNNINTEVVSCVQNKTNPAIRPKEILLQNPYLIVDKNYNIIIDKRILKESGIEISIFNINNKNSCQLKDMIIHSYAIENFKEICLEVFTKDNHVNNYNLNSYIIKPPFLTKNMRNFKLSILPKIFKSRNNENDTLSSSYNQVINTLFCDQFIKKYPCTICNSKNGVVKFCKSCKNAYHQSCYNEISKNNPSIFSLHEIDPDFPFCYNCIRLINKIKKKKNPSIPKKLISQDFLKSLKIVAIGKSNEKWKIIKHHHFQNKKITERFTYSYSIQRNESINENFAIFYQHEISLTNSTPTQKLHKKFELLRDKGSIQQFQKKVFDLFKSLIKFLKEKENL